MEWKDTNNNRQYDFLRGSIKGKTPLLNLFHQNVGMNKFCSKNEINSSLFLSDDRYDAEIVQKLCGAPEEPQFVYEEGCDTIDVPFKMQKCYCRQELCNGGGIPRAEVGLVLALGISLLLGFATM